LAFKKNKHFLQDFVLHLESEFEAEDETKDPFQLLRITSQMWNLLDVLEWIFASPNLFQHQDEAVRKSLERAISSFVEFCENNWLASHGGIVSPLAKALYHREELFSVPQKESALRFVLDRVERGRFGCWELTEVLGRRFYPKVSKRLSSLENPNSNHLNALAACGATDKELLEFQGLTLVVSE